MDRTRLCGDAAPRKGQHRSELQEGRQGQGPRGDLCVLRELAASKEGPPLAQEVQDRTRRWSHLGGGRCKDGNSVPEESHRRPVGHRRPVTTPSAPSVSSLQLCVLEGRLPPGHSRLSTPYRACSGASWKSPVGTVSDANRVAAFEDSQGHSAGCPGVS